MSTIINSCESNLNPNYISGLVFMHCSVHVEIIVGRESYSHNTVHILFSTQYDYESRNSCTAQFLCIPRNRASVHSPTIAPRFPYGADTHSLNWFIVHLGFPPLLPNSANSDSSSTKSPTGTLALKPIPFNSWELVPSSVHIRTVNSLNSHSNA